MTRFPNAAKYILQIARIRVSYKQISAVMVLTAIMLPITAPIPAWAYDLNLPPIADDGLRLTAPGPSFAEFSMNIFGNLFNGAVPFLTSNKENGNDNKKSKTGNSERLVPDVAIVTDAGNPAIAADSKTETSKPAATISKTNPNKLKFSHPLLVEQTEQNVRDSTYTPENNVGTPPHRMELDSPNSAVAARIIHRAGSANYSFGVPFAGLPGRGIDASIGMTYNSRIWNKTGEDPYSQYQYNVDQNWLAPGFTVGYGTLKSHFWSKTIFTTNNQFKTYNEVVPEGFTDPDGTRHQFECKARLPIPGTLTTYGDNTFCSEYGTTDGTFVKLLYYGAHPISAQNTDDKSAYASTYFTLIHTDGSKVTYSAPGAQFGATDFYREHYPIIIQDRNGNQIKIAYKDGKDNIDYIQDTLGRYIRFYYDANADKKLVAVTVPGFNGGTERQTIRFYYQENVSLNFQGRFSGNIIAPATIRTLKYVYFPATGSGYRYDYHPNFGMITKITKLTGMTVAGNSLTSTGSVTADGTEALSTEYTFPNDGSQIPLTTVPKYTQRTDDWLSITPHAPAITYYDVPEPATGVDRTSAVTVKDAGTDFDVEYKTVLYNTNDWKNGLTKETTVTKLYGPTRVYRFQMAKTAYTWVEGIADASGRKSPIVQSVEITNDAGQIRAVSFAYDGHDNQTIVREHDFAATGVLGTELRRTETTYETGAGWTNNRMFHLPSEVKTFANNVVVSKTVYEYDGGSLTDAPGVVQHNPDYNLNAGTHQCNCHYQCDPGDFPPHCPLECDSCPNGDPAAYFRGNVTKVTAFSNAALTTDPDASVHTMSYDITGNVVTASMSCCNVKTLEYSAANQYAYVTKETKGIAPTQMVTETDYNLPTGLAVTTRDENAQPTNFTYDPVTLRQTRVDYANGAWSTVDHNDTAFPYYVKSTSSLDATRSLSNWSYFNGAGQGFQSRSQTASGYISSDVEYDNLGRAVRSYNPYTVAGLTDPRPAGIKYSEATVIDALGRTLQAKLPDDTVVSTAFNSVADTPANFTKRFVTMTDQAGKQRRQLADALGRIVRVDEPDGNGNLGEVTAPFQPTAYEYDGNDNLAKVTQTAGSVTQERVFEYDSLSRLRRERQVEALPTLEINGDHGTPASTKWTGVYNYNTDGLLTDGFDARGIKTHLIYDGLNRVEKVEYTGDTEYGYETPDVEYTYGEAESGFLNVGRLTKIRTLAVSTVNQSTPETVQDYDYDKVGQVKKHIQSIGNQSYQLDYGYNLAGQLTSETYPSGKVVTSTVDNYGVTQTIADAQKTYLNGVTFDNRGVLNQINFGNGTSETYSLNDRFQMESQSLKKGAEVLQQYDYKYGKINSTDGTVDTAKNNGQLARIESFIGANKQSQQRFEYDSIGRLSQSSEYRGDNSSLTYKQKFDFDRFGNLYRKDASNPTSGQANPLPYTPIEEGATSGMGDIEKVTNRFRTATTYDDAGNVTTDNKFRGGMSFAYDANGRNVKVSRSGALDAWTVYDALGNRVATKINDVWQYVVYDAMGKLVAEYGTPSEGLGGVKYVQQDWQGSIRTATSNTGFVLSRTDHQAFGEEIGAGVGLRSSQQGYSGISATRHGYGLTESDQGSGQQHTGFRKLETQAGRWSSPDPYKGSISLGNPQSFNRYSYVGNDPTNFVDPSGLMPCDNPSEYYVPGYGCVMDGGTAWGRGNRLTPYDFQITAFDGIGDPRRVHSDPGGGGEGGQPRRCDIVWNLADTDGNLPTGFVRKSSTNANHQYGTYGAINAIAEIGSTWAASSDVILRAGDISLKNGVDTPDHMEHQRGRQFDIGLPRSDGVNKAVSYQNAEYDWWSTEKLVDQLMQNPNVTKIIFNDPQITGSKIARDKNGKHVHDNHLHVELADGCK